MNNYQHLGYYNALRWSSIAACLQNIAGCAVGDWWWQRNEKEALKTPNLTKKSLNFGIDMLIDHVTIILQTMERVLRASTIQMVMPYKWKVHMCEVSEEQIITEFNYMITFRFASMLRCW